MKHKEIIYTLLLSLLAFLLAVLSSDDFSASHPRCSYYFLLAGSVILFVIWAASSVNVWHLHRRKLYVEKRIKDKARKAAYRRELADKVLACFDALTWRVEGETVTVCGVLRQKLKANSSIVHIGESLEGLDDETRQRVVDFLRISEVGDFHLQLYGNLHSDGPHWYDMHMHVVRINSTLMKFGVTVVIDQLKNQEMLSLETHRRLVNAEQRERFIGMLNHEVRTPLNSILGFSDFLCSSDLTAEDAVTIGKSIVDSGETLSKLIGNILLLTHMDNSNITLNLEESNVAENLCESCVGYHVLREEKNIKVVVEHGPSEAWVCLDHQFMVTVIDDLCSNAIKFSPIGGTVTLGWRVEDDNIIMYVRDEGVGISPEHLPHIFERFYKVDPFTPGVGLGLCVANAFVERMGGRIEVESELGKGSTFNVILKKIK